MKKESSLSRKSFLRTAGSTALFAALGIHFHGCSSGDDNGPGGPTGPGGGSGGGGVSVSANTITIDLTHSSTSHLNSEGGWLLISQADTLAVNVDGQQIRAFTSICTHEGCASGWSYGNGVFTCGLPCGHGSRFSNGGEWISGPEGNTGNLQEFASSRSGNTVTITKS